MEAVAIRIPPGERWVYLCGAAPTSKGPGAASDVVVRAFEAPALVAVGEAERGPDAEPILVPVGQGRRVVGRHVYARAASPDAASLVTYRGM